MGFSNWTNGKSVTLQFTFCLSLWLERTLNHLFIHRFPDSTYFGVTTAKGEWLTRTIRSNCNFLKVRILSHVYPTRAVYEFRLNPRIIRKSSHFKLAPRVSLGCDFPCVPCAALSALGSLLIHIRQQDLTSNARRVDIRLLTKPAQVSSCAPAHRNTHCHLLQATKLSHVSGSSTNTYPRSGAEQAASSLSKATTPHGTRKDDIHQWNYY